MEKQIIEILITLYVGYRLYVEWIVKSKENKSAFWGWLFALLAQLNCILLG